jgi:uncharacterized membrane protein
MSAEPALPTPSAAVPASPVNRALPWMAVAAAVLVIGTWLWNTPPGLLGKADAVGYAICHRIDLRSFHIGDRPLPLCARCTGIYAGLVLGVATMAIAGRSRAGGLPPTRLIIVLLGFVAIMGIDGVNSYMRLFPGLPVLYEPQNWLRLVTGTLNGLAVGAFIYPVFNQTMWRNWQDRPILSSFRELGGLLALAVLLIGIVLTQNPIILYPLALISAAGVVALLTALDTTILLIVFRREARAQTWRQAALPLLIGLTLAIMQIGAVDAVRFAIFRTWSGFVIPG